MGRKAVGLSVTPLGVAEASLLRPPCSVCVRWELDPVAREAARREGHEREAKQAWIREVAETWGPPGFLLRRDDRVVGHVLVAPPALVPGADGFATSPAAPESVLVSSLWVDPCERGGGVGRLLVRTVVRSAAERGVAHVEAFGDNRDPGRACLVPTGFWLSVGFRVRRPHPVTPRLRLDVDTAVGWRDEVDALVGRLVHAVRRPLPAADREPGPLRRRTGSR